MWHLNRLEQLGCYLISGERTLQSEGTFFFFFYKGNKTGTCLDCSEYSLGGLSGAEGEYIESEIREVMENRSKDLADHD